MDILHHLGAQLPTFLCLWRRDMIVGPSGSKKSDLRTFTCVENAPFARLFLFLPRDSLRDAIEYNVVPYCLHALQADTLNHSGTRADVRNQAVYSVLADLSTPRYSIDLTNPAVVSKD